MFLDIHELERHPVEFTEEFQPGVIDFGEDIHQRTPAQGQRTRRIGRGAARQAQSCYRHTPERSSQRGSGIKLRPLPRTGGPECDAGF